MHDEVRGTGGQRTQALAARVYKPTRCKQCSEVKVALDQWDQDLKLYEKTSGVCTEDTKLYSIRQIVPDELEQDIVRNAHTLKAYPEVREYVDEQVQLKREIGAKKSSTLDSTHHFELSDAEKVNEMYACIMYNEEEEGVERDTQEKFDMIMSFVKGGGKGGKGGGGKFEGNCNHCGKWGHRLRDCWEKDKEMQQKGKGKGKEGGKGGGFSGGFSKGQWGGGGGKGSGGGGGKGQWGGGGTGFHGGGGKGYSGDWGKGGSQLNNFQYQTQDFQSSPNQSAGGWSLNCSEVFLEPKKTCKVLPQALQPPGLQPRVLSSGGFDALMVSDEDEAMWPELNMMVEASEDEHKEKCFHVVKDPALKVEKKKKKIWKTFSGVESDARMGKEKIVVGKTSIEEALAEFRTKRTDLCKSDTVCPLFMEPRIDQALSNEEEPEHFKVDEQGWTRVRGVMDSGASKSVAQPNMCPQYKLQESVGSKSGRGFKCAGKTSIPSLGQKHLPIVNRDWAEGTARYQVADISRPLNSVSEICDGGGRHGSQVVFGRTGGIIYNLDTGKETYFDREEGIYILEFWVPPECNQVFQGQGR